MKPTGRIDFAFENDLVVCLKDEREDSKLQVSFEESLTLQMAAAGVQ